MTIVHTPNSNTAKPFRFLLADDDGDDRFFFEKAIKTLNPETQVAFVEDGQKLMDFLETHHNNLPDVLFLDLNMPRKNGSECLRDIRKDPRFDNLAIIIYSTSSHVDVADVLYKNGAHYYVRKPDLTGLVKVLKHVLGLLIENQFGRPERAQFILKVA